MKLFLSLLPLLAASVSAGPISDYAASGAKYPSAPGQDYKPGDPKCTPYYDTVQKDRCESYTERVCTTTQQESCTDIPDQQCTAVVNTQNTNQCFDVTEQICTLKEDVTFDSIDVPFVVQKCSKVPEQVCDTVYATVSRSASDQGCVDVTNSACQNYQNTIYDQTCKTTVVFDCDSSAAAYPDDQAGAAYPSGGNSYGSGASGSSSYGSGSSYGSSGSGDANAYSANTGYGNKEPNCRRTSETKCYKTPRPVSSQQCTKKTDKVCQNWQVETPSVDARQNCHDDEKKVCELEQRTQQKQVKKYVYSKQCQPVSRKICGNGQSKTIVPQCTPTTRRQCTYTPVEKCDDVPKQYCYKYSYQVQKQKCDSSYPSAGGYSAGGNAGGAGGAGATKY